jgi:hypothetical protein
MAAEAFQAFFAFLRNKLRDMVDASEDELRDLRSSLEELAYPPNMPDVKGMLLEIADSFIRSGTDRHSRANVAMMHTARILKMERALMKQLGEEKPGRIEVVSHSVPMRVLQSAVDQGVVDAHTGRPLSHEELAIMMACCDIGKSAMIDRCIQRWREGAIFVYSVGDRPAGWYVVDIPEEELQG